ncbi:hypothetical protein ScPMuIL_000817 [Solemya velum]
MSHSEMLLFLLLTSSAASSITASIELYGAGATFPNDVYQAWITAYRAYRAEHVNLDMKYEGVGSGDGIARITGRKEPSTHYAGSEYLLKEEDYLNNRDLKMLPSMAGSLRYIGINRNIHAVPVRRFQEWSSYPGIFNEGLDDNDTPMFWNSSVVDLYGKTTRGMTGLILSIRYTIGYIALSAAKTADLQTAMVVNMANHTVVANMTTVQNAMNDFSHVADMAHIIVNPPGNNSYPIAAYTYFIVKTETMQNCDTALELVRYIHWFLNKEEPRQECSYRSMIPLSDEIVNKVIETVLKKMTCKDNYMYISMLAQLEKEQRSVETWRLPMMITGPFVCIIFVILFGYMIRDQIKTHKALLKNEWRISNEELHDEDHIQMRAPEYNTITNMKSSLRTVPLRPNKTVAWKKSLVHVARKGDMGVILAPMSKLSTTVNFDMKKKLLWMRNSVQHCNVVHFWGLTEKDGSFFSVCELTFRFTLEDFLSMYKNNLNSVTQTEISHDIARGMNYLHDRRIIHGSLRAKHCFVDNRWSIKIGNWMQPNLVDYQTQNAVQKFKMHEETECQTGLQDHLWLAPEILKFGWSPSYSSDVYSYAMTLQEIFTYEQPYAEHYDSQTLEDMLSGIVSCYLRPTFGQDTPKSVRDLMELAWDMDPSGRPTFSYILAYLKRVSSTSLSVMDCMMESLEKRIHKLEHTATIQSANLKKEKERADVYLSGLVPAHIASKLATRAHMKTEIFDNLTVMVLDIPNIGIITQSMTPENVTSRLNELHVGFENIFSYSDFCCLNESSFVFTVISGIVPSSTNHTKCMSTIALDCLEFATSFLLDKCNDIHLNLKIGLSSGRIVAGLVGNACKRYFFLGSASQKAKLLSNSAVENTIRVSFQTSLQLKAFPIFIVQETEERTRDCDGEKAFWLVGRKDRAARYYPTLLS